METDSFSHRLETSDGAGGAEVGAGLGGLGVPDGAGTDSGWYLPYPISFQVSLTSFLMLELVLGFSSNLTVLVLYCAQSNLVDSVSNMVTVNLHVLDIIVCVLCLPLTVVIILLPVNRNLALLCCFHEACVTFSSIATAVNVLVISVDRYDISVRPANRLLTPRRAALLLAAVWAISLAVFFIPFLEVEFFSGLEGGPGDPSLAAVWRNRTLLCVGGQGDLTGLPMYYHLLLQVPAFFTAVVVMLFTYSKILRALNIRIGSHLKKGPRFKGQGCRGRRRKRKMNGAGAAGEEGELIKPLSHPPLIPSPTPTPTATSPPPLSSAPLIAADGGTAPAPPPPAVGVQASVSAIIALRRAVRRHRDRRERQRRVFKMSLIIISTFLGCWAPISVANVLILSLGPSDWLVRLRLCFLALAYGTTVFHPLLYAFARQKLRRALRSKVKKRVVSLLQVDPAPSGTVIHNSWVEPRKGRKARQEGSDGTDRCLTEAVRE
ncbi:G-protein coupled receptor 22-like [Anguilla anguilla]|uniref:G-protein coupled receptor 22-like n=1 Tax=Anguilla anguilla TaxID=7936 RepID=UPI0015AED2EA|nr:G-protein coupled receptor 22-like [Anguilla anguilla]XP_035243252.1 G-protein coupled receptor 22-like [Anguilla anguilla]XP_035243253.1 G-protein coupled receptor 22-like [Anguilla anguilla]